MIRRDMLGDEVNEDVSKKQQASESAAPHGYGYG